MRLLPSKWVLLAIAALITACVVLWQANAITNATLTTARLELSQANEKIDIQLKTILTMQRDATVERQLLDTANTNISAIRDKAQADTHALTQRDLASEANVDAKALESALNERFNRTLKEITEISCR